MLLVNLRSGPLHLCLFFIIVCWGEGEVWTGHWVHVAVGVFIDCISNVEIINYFMKLNKRKSWKLHVHSYKHNFKSTCTCKCDWLKLHFRWGYMKWKSVFYFLNIKVMDMIVNMESFLQLIAFWDTGKRFTDFLFFMCSIHTLESIFPGFCQLYCCF